MAHASGNPTWQDWPSVATEYTAATTEAWENAIDRLTIAQFGAVGRTAPYRCTVVYNASFTISNNVETYASAPGNWLAFSDPDNMFNNTASGGGYTGMARIYIPVTGKWDLEALCLGQTAANTQASATISTSSATTAPTVAANGIVKDERSIVVAGTQDITLNPHIVATLNAGTYVYWSNWASAANSWGLYGTLPNTQMRTQIRVTWDGPA